jgi:hypothetical protein
LVSRFDEPASDIARDIEGFRNRASLRNQTGHFV